MTALALVVLVLLSGEGASACGDKLLHLNRIHRLHAIGINSTVLIFSRPNSLLEAASGMKFEKAFRDEGYSLLLVNNDRDLAMALQSGAANVVIADIADAAAVRNMKAAAPLQIIPVVAKGDLKSESDAKRYPAVIKSPAKPGKFLDAIDRTFDSNWARQSAKLQATSSIQ
jgi:DNA-binding NtrC family response regulator